MPGRTQPTGRGAPLPRFTPLLAGALLLATVSVARADPPSCEDPVESCASQPSQPSAHARPLRSGALGRGDGPHPTPQEPYRGRQAVAYPLARLGFFARSEDYALHRGHALDDVEGGAVLQLDRGLGLAAAYRMLGSGVGFDSLVLGAGGRAGIAAPFVSLVVDF